MRAVVLSIGSELLRGDILDTNAAFLTRSLSQIGFDVLRVSQIGDDLQSLTEAVGAALGVAQVTVCTGGLGPTQDDLTRDAIAGALHEEMFGDPALVDALERRWSVMNRRMPDSNFRQTMRIPSADAIPNPNGTAPGWFVQRDGKVIVAMPGPPSEMQPMWVAEVQDRLARLLATATAMRSIMTFGVGESAAELLIEDVISWRDDVTVATYAKPNGVQVHVTAHASSAADAARLADEAAGMIRKCLGGAVVGEGEITLSAAVGEMVGRRGQQIAVMESASGGEVSSMITDTPGSSEYFAGGVVAYTRTVKEAHGVPADVMDKHGLISAETATAMALAIRQRLGTDIGIGVTGIAGNESVEGRPPGTCFVAVSLDGAEEVREIHRPGSRALLKRYFAQCALDLLRLQLLEVENNGP